MNPLLFAYVLKAAKRDRFIVSLFLVLVLIASLSIFMGSTAVIEKDQFSAVFAAGSIRFLNIFGLSLFVTFFIRRSFEARDVEFLLTRPVDRVRFLISYVLAFIVLGILTAFISMVAIAVMAPHMFSEATVIWGMSLAIENAVIVSVALFFALVLSSPAAIMFATGGFYVLARMMSHFLGIVDANIVQGTEFKIMGIVLESVSMLVPRLDLLTQSSWLLYGAEPATLIFTILHALIFMVLIVSMSLVDLLLRRF